MIKRLVSYEADAGTCVINGIGFNNGTGDGGFDVFYADRLPRGAKLIKDVWIDLRNDYPLIVHTYDCNRKGEEFSPNITIDRKQFGNTQALQVAIDNGTIYLVKYF